jgi:hypothetical protein
LCNIKAPIKCAIATHLQERFVANCSDSKSVSVAFPGCRATRRTRGVVHG